MKTLRTFILIFVGMVGCLTCSFAAEPTGRIAVGPDTTPGDGTHLYRIEKPGSYFLNDNVIGVPGKAGILINSGGVTLDLNGMNLIGTGSGAWQGLRILAEGPVRIVNGAIRNWGSSGIVVYQASVEIESVHVTDNGYIGITLNNPGASGLVRDCVIENNEGLGMVSNALKVSVERCQVTRNLEGLTIERGIVRNCIVTSNVKRGIALVSGSVENSRAEYNGDVGIQCGHGTVENCTAIDNRGHGIVGWAGLVRSCVAKGNKGSGIHITDGQVLGCTVSTNDENGIYANGNSVVSGNHATGHQNTSGKDKRAGILVMKSGNRIENNNVTQNTIGVEVWGDRNLIIGNTANKNDTSYFIIAGNRVGTIVVPPLTTSIINGYVGGASGTTDPWSNLAY